MTVDQYILLSDFFVFASTIMVLLNLYNPFSSDLSEEHDHAQRIIFYAESRFRSILIAYNQADQSRRGLMTNFLRLESVCAYQTSQILFELCLIEIHSGIYRNGDGDRVSN